MKKIGAYCLVFLLLALPVFAGTQQFHGTVLLNGVDAPDDTLITIFTENSTVTTKTRAGSYGEEGLFFLSDAQASPGETIFFYVGNMLATTNTFVPRTKTKVDLEVSFIPFSTSHALFDQPHPRCSPVWSCSRWSLCDGEAKFRLCTDTSFCNTTFEKPVERQECVVSPISGKAVFSLPTIPTQAYSVFFLVSLFLLATFFGFRFAKRIPSPRQKPQHPKLISYIQRHRAQGFSDEEIFTVLQEAGWSAEDIDAAKKAL